MAANYVINNDKCFTKVVVVVVVVVSVLVVVVVVVIVVVLENSEWFHY